MSPSPKFNSLSRRGFLMGAAGVAGIAALGPLLAACSSPASGEAVTSGKVDVSVWTNDKNYPAFFRTRAESLSKEGPYDYKVSEVVSSDIWTKALAAYAAKSTVPSLMGIEISQFSRFMRNNIAEGVFADLSGKMGAPDDAFIAARVDPYRLNGKIYAMESATTIATTYKRVDLWDKYSIPATDTWDDFVKVGGEQNKKNGIHMGLLGSTDAGIFPNLLFQRGGQAFDEDGNQTVDSPEALEVLQLLHDGVQNGTFALTTDLWGGPGVGMMKSNKIAAFWQADWFNPFYLVPNLPEQKGLWMIENPPVFAGGGFPTSVSGGTGFAVTKDRPETEATLALLQDAYGTESGQIERFSVLGYLPSLKSAWEVPEVLNKEDAYLGGQKVMDVYKPLSTQLPTQQQDLRYSDFLAAANIAVSDMFAGKLTPKEAQKQIVDKLKK
ncbi:ABC transporter substrate-binding protein [Microbacterium sp. H1-D42]|uniref:ABC transporter substrate-binding protein n=1 Tax=Microbacterium sp. H1-D42 TaxID=2925844 RepID=UPI001F53B60A|nr:ABC transporter substrate-binding protein [Microbacterium sp. H1-D42]UNK70466.1 ABC transporter substrate-binding protein [Microbacterium sp. H1-D42]